MMTASFQLMSEASSCDRKKCSLISKRGDCGRKLPHPRGVGHGLLLLGEGDLGDAGLVAEVVHEAVEVGVHGRHREQREREELRQDEDGYGCQRQSGRRRRSY